MKTATLPWTKSESCYCNDGPSENVEFEALEIRMSVQIINSTGFATGRAHYRIGCITCDLLLHEATTSATIRCQKHLRVFHAIHAVCQETPSTSNRPLTPSDIENYMLSILPDSVPPELVADAVVVLAPLGISPETAGNRLISILRDAMASTVGVEGTWTKQLAKLYIRQGWHPAEYWSSDNLRAFIDETIERHCGES